MSIDLFCEPLKDFEFLTSLKTIVKFKSKKVYPFEYFGGGNNVRVYFTKENFVSIKNERFEQLFTKKYRVRSAKNGLIIWATKERPKLPPNGVWKIIDWWGDFAGDPNFDDFDQATHYGQVGKYHQFVLLKGNRTPLMARCVIEMR